MAGLRSDDLIIGVNRQRIKNIAELRAILKEQDNVFALNIIRGNSSLFLMIR
jgi:serine protease Do/serine protease DegQ